MPKKSERVYLSTLLKHKSKVSKLTKIKHHWLSFGMGKLLTSEPFTRGTTARVSAKRYTYLMAKHVVMVAPEFAVQFLKEAGYNVIPPPVDHHGPEKK